MAAVKLTPAEEEAIIKQRYLTQMTVPKGNLPLKVLTKKYERLAYTAYNTFPEFFTTRSTILNFT